MQVVLARPVNTVSGKQKIGEMRAHERHMAKDLGFLKTSEMDQSETNSQAVSHTRSVHVLTCKYYSKLALTNTLYNHAAIEVQNGFVFLLSIGVSSPSLGSQHP